MKKSTRTRLISGARDEKGQAAIELLVVFPIFILFLLMVVDFGLLMYQYVTVSNAVREGARYGAVNCNTPSGTCTQALVCDRTFLKSSGFLTSPSASEVSVGWTDRSSPSNASNRDKGDSVIVSATHPYNFLFLPVVTVDVVSSADMRLEQRDGAGGAVNLPSAGTACS